MEILCLMDTFKEDVDHLLARNTLPCLLDSKVIVPYFIKKYLILRSHYHVHFYHQMLEVYFIKFYHLNLRLTNLNHQGVIVCCAYLSQKLKFYIKIILVIKILKFNRNIP